MGELMSFWFLWSVAGAIPSLVVILWMLIPQAIEEVRKDREPRDARPEAAELSAMGSW